MIKENNGEAVAKVEDIAAEGEEFSIDELENVAGGQATVRPFTKITFGGEVGYD